MIPFLLAPLFAAAALAPAAAPPATPARLPQPGTAKTCIDLVRAAPAKAVTVAEDWRRKGGGLDAAQCGALALVALERWPEAAFAFEQAALEAERLKDLRSADYWVQGGNAWLAGGDPAKARKDLDRALATTLLAPQLRGEAYLDRARASVAAGDAAGARVDIDQALALVPRDPFAWYLSAALARQQSNLKRAQDDIAKALTLAANDPALLLEAGNIVGVAGNADGARTFYRRAAQAGPDSEPGRAAAAALADPPQPKQERP